MKQLDIAGIFKSDADDLRKAREDAIRIHKTTNIRAAGNEVEMSVREYFKQMLPPRYYVTHGHLIDINGSISKQLDIIIADNFGLPALMKTNDGTEYIPIDSVYAYGEIKSTYYKSKQYIEEFSDDIKDIRENLYHEEIPNTIYHGLQAETNMRDVFLGKRNQLLNYIYKFILFVDGGDFDFRDVSKHYNECDNKYLPNTTILLNKGVIACTKQESKQEKDGLAFHRYPEYDGDKDLDWTFCPLPGDGNGSLEGNHLGFLHWTLLEHLADSHLEPPSLTKYISKMLIGRKSRTVRASALLT